MQFKCQDNLDIDAYRTFNGSFNKRVIFTLGYNGLFSELLTQCAAMTYAANNGYKFELDACNTGFVGKNGFEQIWQPCFPMSSNPLYRRFNKQGLKNKLKRSLQNIVLTINSDVLHPDVLSNTIINDNFYQHKFTVPGSDEPQRIVHVLNYFLRLILQCLKTQIKENIETQINQLQLPSHYIAMHIRRGDKLTIRSDMTRPYKPEEYFEQLPENKRTTKDIYIFSDDFHAIEEMAAHYPDVNWIHREQTHQTGYKNIEYLKLPQAIKIRRIIKLISDFYICSNSQYFVGPYSSNFTRAVGIYRLNKEISNIDVEIEPLSWQLN